MKKRAKHLQLLDYLKKYRCFTIRDVLRWTNSNNPYRTVEHLKAHITIKHIDVQKEDVRFRVYYITKNRALDLIQRGGWRIAA